MRRLIVLVLVFLFLCLQAEAGVNTDLDALIAAALANNLDLKKQELAVQSAKESLVNVLKVEDSKISVSTDYSYGESLSSVPGASPAPFSTSAGITVPLFSQLSLSGRISDQGTGSVSLAYSPFSYDTAGFKAEENYKKAVNQWVALKQQTIFAVESGVLNWNYAVANEDYLKKAYQLEEDKYTAMKKQYELDVSTYDDLAAEEQNYLQARQKYYDGENALLKSRQTIYNLLGSGMEKTVIPQIQITDLLNMIAARDTLITGSGSPVVSSDKLKSLNLELATLEKELAVLFPVQPSINLTGSIGLPAFSFQASAAITLTASDFKFKDIADLKTSIAVKKEEIAAEKYGISLDVQMLEQSIRIAREVLELNQNDLKTADINLKEANFLLTTGERTTLEVRQTELSRQSAEIREYQAAVSLYSAQANYLALL